MIKKKKMLGKAQETRDKVGLCLCKHLAKRSRKICEHINACCVTNVVLLGWTCLLELNQIRDTVLVFLAY